MDWYSSIFEVIDLRSFSNLWYWIGLAVLWSSSSHWVLGIPYDMVTRARRSGGVAMEDLQDIARVNVNRTLEIVRVAGVWLTALGMCVLTILALTGFFYGAEFSQAVFLMGLPMFIVSLMNVGLARRIRLEKAQNDHLCRLILRTRIYIQLVGTVSIFVTALWGMYQNISISVLGG